jgi:thiosulfate/3-mercaptopyruvate sulfurtransferase
MVPTPARFAKVIGALGVGARPRGRVYDQKGLHSAPRGWWLLRLFGHEKVAVLDGGLPKWKAEGRRLEAGEPPSVMPRPSCRPGRPPPGGASATSSASSARAPGRR